MTTTDPQPTRRALVVVWLIVAVLLGALLVVARLFEGPLDDPNQAFQRPGLLDVGSLPVPAVPVTAAVPRPGRPAVVFFTRTDQLDELCAALSAAQLTADLAVVVPTAGACGPVPVVADPSARLASAYRLRVPADGGPPVGYAVVDGLGRIRYATLDPGLAGRLREVRTILGAV